MKYNHAYTFGFSLENESEEGEATAAELRAAILKMLFELSDIELRENCDMPFDTYEVEP